MSIWNLNEYEKFRDKNGSHFRCVPTGAEYRVHWIPLLGHPHGGEYFPVKPSKNINERPIAFLDLETTGDSHIHNDIIDIAIIRTDRDLVYEQKCMVVNHHAWDPEAKKITGYTDEDWSDSVPFSMVASEVFEWLASDGPAIVGHNIYRFDWMFLEWRLKSLGFPAHQLGRPIIDTMSLAFTRLRGQVEDDAGLSLNACCRALGIPEESAVHRAIEGARRCKAIYEKLA